MQRVRVLTESEVQSLTVVDEVLAFARGGDMVSLRERDGVQGALCINKETLSMWWTAL